MKTIITAVFASFLLSVPAVCEEFVYYDLISKARAYADRCAAKIIRPHFDEVRETCEKAMDRKFNNKEITEEQLVRLKNEFRKYLIELYYTGPTDSKVNSNTVLNEIYDFAFKRTQEIPRPSFDEVLKAGKDKADAALREGKISGGQSSDFNWFFYKWLESIYAKPQPLPASPPPALPQEEYAALEIQRQQAEILEQQRKLKAEMEYQQQQIEKAKHQREVQMMQLQQQIERERWQNQHR